MKSWKKSTPSRLFPLFITLVVTLGSNLAVREAKAQQPQPSQLGAQLLRADPIANLLDSVSKGIVPGPKLFVDALRFLTKIRGYDGIADPDVRNLLISKAGTEFAVSKIFDVLADVVIVDIQKQGHFRPDGILGRAGIDRFVLKEFLTTVKNAFLLDVKGQIIDSAFILAESWDETVRALDLLPPKELLTPQEQEYFKFLYAAKGAVDRLRSIKAELKALGKELLAGVASRVKNIVMSNALEDFKPVIRPLQAVGDGFGHPVKPTVDASQVTRLTPQSTLTPFEGSFTQNFSGTLTQTPDSPFSPGANFSGTFSGTRQGVVPGNFGGTVAGRTTTFVPGDFAPSLMNAPFSGSSSGTVRGFNGQPLTGNMSTSVTVPAISATASVAGPVTINPNGSLSHSFSGTSSTLGVVDANITGSLTQTP